jgi:VIT1/CCC1 family predicted Fe2+/Mn2+ transporter
MSMAVGEYVSVHVHSQADTEQAELKRERVELRTTRASTRKLAPIYVARGLDPSLAKQVAMQLTGRACPRRIRHH